MKKGIVILLVGLALVVLVSPGLIGRLAERSVDQNLTSGTYENPDVFVTAERFDRGWFTTEGQHRVEFRDGGVGEQYRAMLALDPEAPLPVLVISTRIDHGIIPVASLGREDGSLAPGLGDAVSTLAVEMPDGRTIDLPGAIHSSIGLGGNLTSAYELLAGSYSDNGIEAAWGDSNIELTSTADLSRVGLDADIASLDFSGGSESFNAAGIRLRGEQYPSGYGFLLGRGDIEIETFRSAGGTAGPLKISGDGRVAGEELELAIDIDMTLPMPGVGQSRMRVDMDLGALDPVAFGRFATRYEQLAETYANQPQQLAALIDPEAQALMAGGLRLELSQLDIELPDGTLQTTLSAHVPESDPDDFTWTSLMLGTEAEARVVVPETLMDFILSMNPQAGAAVGMGYLKKDGDRYVSDIEMQKGLLTINGAPMALPLPGR